MVRNKPHFEIGGLVRILSGKHRGAIANARGEDESSIIVDLGGGLLKRFSKDSISPVRSFYRFNKNGHPVDDTNTKETI